MVSAVQYDCFEPIIVKHKLSNQLFTEFLCPCFSCCFSFPHWLPVFKPSTPGVSCCDALCPVVPACICQLTPGRIQDEPAWLSAPRSVSSSSAPCSTTSQLHPVWLPAAVSLEMPFASGTGNVHRALGSCLSLDFLSPYVMLVI